MKFIFSILLTVIVWSSATAQNLFVADTFVTTINLDLSQNAYLKSVPVDLIKGFCEGKWNAYYPKKEMVQCLADDFLKHYDKYQRNIIDTTQCPGSYWDDIYYMDFFKEFCRKLRYKEIVYFDQQHSIIKREVLWIQVYYSQQGAADGWLHHESIIFWMKEISGKNNCVQVYNKRLRANGWCISNEFEHPDFIVNENKDKDDKKKLNKYNNQVEEY